MPIFFARFSFDQGDDFEWTYDLEFGLQAERSEGIHLIHTINSIQKPTNSWP